MSYVYIKSIPSTKQSKKIDLHPKAKKSIAVGFFIIGILLFGSAVLPIIQFQIEYSIKFKEMINPLSSYFYNNGSVLGQVDTDYTQLSTWFNSSSETSETVLENTSLSKSAEYTISIPKLKIDNAVVMVGSMDLKKSLIQYSQTALPGTLGNTVIFGHSVLPQFFNPKSYLTIFSTLYRLKPGDEIYIDYDNIHYKYVVEEMYEVTPTDLSVLEQRFDNKYLTLITCSPPGTYLRRLVVRTRLEQI